jgi:NADPH2:quinone reductase
MRTVRFETYGGPEVLSVVETERPEPGAGELLVAVEAASVNPVDTYFREGAYEPATLPWVPGADAAGTVVETGSETGFEVGDRVFATGLGRNHPGTCAEYVAVPEGFAAPLPESVDFETGAALALVGVTAWQSLVVACGLRPADRVLVHGGSGGVGHVAVGLAAAAGARVTATAAPTYHEDCRELGAETVLDYDRAGLADAIRDAGEPDAILDHRADDYLSLDAAVAADDATVAVIGNDEPAAAFEDVPACRGKGLSVHHVSMFNTPDIGAVLERLGRLVADGELTAVVARRYGLDEVPEAHRAVMADSYLGKLVVTP